MAEKSIQKIPRCAKFELIIIGKELTHFYSMMLVGISGSFVWEVMGPVINKNSVADFADVICYLCGTFLYYVLWRLLTNKSKHSS